MNQKHFTKGDLILEEIEENQIVYEFEYNTVIVYVTDGEPYKDDEGWYIPVEILDDKGKRTGKKKTLFQAFKIYGHGLKLYSYMAYNGCHQAF